MSILLFPKQILTTVLYWVAPFGIKKKKKDCHNGLQIEYLFHVACFGRVSNSAALGLEQEFGSDLLLWCKYTAIW